MLDEIRFSSTGEPPTPFECRLLMTAGNDNWASQLALRLAPRFGPGVAAEIVCALLDELQGERIRVPPGRREFFSDLWREERTQLILLLDAKPDFTRTDIARMLGVDPATVTRTCNGGPRGKPKPGKNRRP